MATDRLCVELFRFVSGEDDHRPLRDQSFFWTATGDILPVLQVVFTSDWRRSFLTVLSRKMILPNYSQVTNRSTTTLRSTQRCEAFYISVLRICYGLHGPKAHQLT